MAKKSMFQIFDEMNKADGENNTQHLAISNNHVSITKAKKGAHITFGVPFDYLGKIAGDEVLPMLLLIDKKEYFRREESEAGNG